MVDVWMICSMLVPFLEVAMHCYMRVKKEGQGRSYKYNHPFVIKVEQGLYLNQHSQQ